LIPFSHSEKLQKNVPKRSHLFTIEQAHHNNLPQFPEYHDFLYDILNDDDFFEHYFNQIPKTI
jgi:hypothetical protein